ncbi:MAG: hypothetical protein WC869_00555 [Phycisphaerae bacterium]
MINIFGNGVLVSRRSQVWGTGAVFTKTGSQQNATITQPIDEAKTNIFPINNPGGQWGAQYPKPTATSGK